MATAERMRTYVRREGDCLIWLGKPSAQGYGRVNHEGRQQLAHRVAWLLLVGPIPEGYEIDHVAARGCVSRLCVNVAHLEPVTKLVNLQRGWEVHRKPTCPKGHTRFSYRAGRNGRRDRRCLDCHLEREYARYHGA